MSTFFVFSSILIFDRTVQNTYNSNLSFEPLKERLIYLKQAIEEFLSFFFRNLPTQEKLIFSFSFRFAIRYKARNIIRDTVFAIYVFSIE